MEPKIAHRCLACGASVRGAASFCPECGRPLKASAAQGNTLGETPELPARRKTDNGGTAPFMATSSSAAEPVQEIPAREMTDDNRLRAESIVLPVSETEDRSKRHRMTAAAREAVEGKIAPRVEKLRQASNVMLEEASYDPSLRFVLVAIAIFLLSLLILLLNHLLG